ncbi:molybdopterin-dependent oxidoreductase, partial [Salmonella enterica subsp. enterica serovar Anatum]|nr:molybdopterin-dependent oxidoreductase [Salmonella enterica subsp. enterica serovar Anatum]
GELASDCAVLTPLIQTLRHIDGVKALRDATRGGVNAVAHEFAWIPIRPGTDAALVNGLAYVLITENMVDQPFLDKYCVGYDEKT